MLADNLFPGMAQIDLNYDHTIATTLSDTGNPVYLEGGCMFPSLIIWVLDVTTSVLSEVTNAITFVFSKYYDPHLFQKFPHLAENGVIFTS